MAGSRRSLAVAVAFYLDRCITTERGCLISATRRRDWYGEINYEGKRTSAHRAVYMAAYGLLPDDEVVRHKCDNPPCVHLGHLERGSVAQNTRDCYDRDRRRDVNSGAEGEANPSAILNAELVAQFRSEHRAGATIAALARAHGFSHSSVYGAVRGTSWKHVAEPPVPRTRQWSTHNPNRLPDETALRARDLAAAGLSLGQIAEQIGCHRSTAYELTHRELGGAA